mmetsp:Transcript_80312/g.130147  ORF Transcript_80312/g.130147 Transcript_80312/m.130147 type:complete len:80 (+) Transcript_80312:19-258(+)
MCGCGCVCAGGCGCVGEGVLECGKVAQTLNVAVCVEVCVAACVAVCVAVVAVARMHRISVTHAAVVQSHHFGVTSQSGF